MGDRRIISDRQQDAADAIDRLSRDQGGTPALAVQVYDGGSMGSAAPAFFLCYPVEISGLEAEGVAWASLPDTDRSIPVIVLGKVPTPGDVLIAEMIGSKWVAELGSSSSSCRWICGPSITIAPPSDPFQDTAQASLTVADDSSIGSVNLLYGGFGGYRVAHPVVTIAGGGGHGATAQATVGEVIRIVTDDAGGGYDPASPPNATIDTPTGGSGSVRATATVAVDPGGTVSVTLAGGGALYEDPNPRVTIDPPPAGPKARQARATAYASPEVVTSLKLTAKGSGYTSNTPPDYLNFTVACDAWSFSLRLDPADLSDAGPPGSQKHCSYLGTNDVTVPGAGATTLRAIVLWRATTGWQLWIDFAVAQDPTRPTACRSLTFGTVYSMKPAAGYPGTPANPGHVPLEHGPYGPTFLSCPSRPFAYSAPAVRLGIDDRSYPSGEEGWYVLAGGTCPNPPGDPQPNLFLAISLTEP